MKYRKLLSNVCWAHTTTIIETETDLKYKKYKKLCDHCQMITNPNCPRRKLSDKNKKNMIATRCTFFLPKPIIT